MPCPAGEGVTELVTPISPTARGVRSHPSEAKVEAHAAGAAAYPGFYDLIGIESPGLTAAPAIAEEIARLIRG